MAAGIIIRNASEKDIAAIHEITQEAFEKYAFDSRQTNIKALAEKPEDIEHELKQKQILIGELEGEYAGSIRYEILPKNICYISRFGVKLFAQSRGMGGALVNEVVKAAQNAACKAVCLHTSAKMYSLVRFYYGKGFFIHSTSPEKGYMRALFVKELNGLDSLHDYRMDIPASY